MKKKLLAAVFGAVLVLGACGGGDKSDEADKGKTDGDTVAVDAEAIVQQSCVSCHGGNLEGGGGPALNEIGATLSEEEIEDVIVNGKGGMPGGIIKDEAEVKAVAEWLAAKK